MRIIRHNLRILIKRLGFKYATRHLGHSGRLRCGLWWFGVPVIIPSFVRPFFEGVWIKGEWFEEVQDGYK